MDSICSVIFSLVFFFLNRDLSSNNISSLPEGVFLTLKTLERLYENINRRCNLFVLYFQRNISMDSIF